MSRKTLLAPLLVAALTACGGSKAPASLSPIEVPAADAPAAPPRIEPVELTAGQAPAGPPPIEVLRSWDVRRAEAWAEGDAAALAALYTRDSLAGRRDVAMLRAWTARGLVVRGLRTQLLAVDEQAQSRSAWSLRVTDRLVGGVATGRGVRRPLPRDQPTTRTVRLRWVDGAWLVAWVTVG
jgi:hypothetical protein